MSIKNWYQDKELNLLEGRGILVNSDKINLVFDYDGVMTAPQELKAEAINGLGYNIGSEHADNRLALDEMIRQTGKSKDEVKADYKSAVCNLYLTRPLDLPPAKDAIDVLNRLQDSGKFNNYIVTSRESTPEMPLAQAAGKWLKHYGLKFKGVINTNNTNKKPYLDVLSPLVFVDDSAHKLMELFDDEECTVISEDLKKTKMIFYRHLANERAEVRGNISEVKSWLELEEMIQNSIGV